MKIERASDSVDEDEGSCGCCLLPKRKEEMRGKKKTKRKRKSNKYM